MSFAAQPKSKGDEEKATQALHRMMEEDLALHIQRDPQTQRDHRLRRRASSTSRSSSSA